VPRPDAEQTRAIAARLYAEIVSEHNWGFAAEADESVLDKLADLPPRDMRKQLMSAFGNARLAGRYDLQLADFPGERRNKSRRMGF